jgi:hypothetical protein
MRNQPEFHAIVDDETALTNSKKRSQQHDG